MTAHTSDLAAWLLEQNTADVLAAQAYLNTGGDDAVAALAGWVEVSGDDTDTALAHFERHQPERVLGEGYAKRRIIEQCAAILAVDGWEYDDAPNLAWQTLCLLALPMADRKGYRDEWRPEWGVS